MAGLWPRTGNVTVTNGSKIVTGFGTKWKTGTLPIQKGHTFYGPDNFAYEVDTVVSDESLTLVEAYRGGTLANQGYRIDITRTSTISQFAADLASLVAKYRAWFDGMMTWLTGSGDVAILNPDTGANVTIPSWKKVASEGEGQAARAKVEADRAKTEADRALTEADRAAGIVALAALPMPDVWAPLSDSLRMITGYGRDVLVGSDVVARMVNFSRNSTATYIGKDGQLKTAAANEPRFEKEGLLIEGQSTNLIVSSEKDYVTGSSASNYTVETRLLLDGRKAVKFIAIEPRRPVAIATALASNSTVTVGWHTASFLCDVDLTGDNGYMRGVTAPLVVRKIRDGLYRASVTINIPTAGASELHIYPSVAVTITGLQLEALPFASSYIPTNGAAATRAADVCSVQRAGNFVVPVTIGCNYNLLSANRSGLAPAQLLGFVASDKTYDGLLVIASSPLLKLQSMNEFDGGSSPGVTCQLFGTAVFRAANGVRNEFSSGAFGVPTQGDWKGQTLGSTLYIGRTESSDNARYLFGHIRNLRIWHRALTDNQIKAVA